MDLSKLQIIALVVLTTILTDKFLINHSYPVSSISNSITPTPIVTIAPMATSSATVSSSQNELILKEIQNLRSDMNSTLNTIQTKNISSEAVPTLSSSLIGGMVKIASSQWKRVDVYEKPNTSSKIISSISYDTIYFYGQKTDGWYQLNLDGGLTGWTQSQFLKEYP
jgi:hypothetical protein